MRRFTNWCLILVCSLSLGLHGCDSGSGDTTGGGGGGTVGADGSGSGSGSSTTGDASTSPEPEATGWSAEGSISDMTPMEIPDDCGFDEALEGSALGQHIANMKYYGLELDDGSKEKYQLHYDCGGGSKAIWIFLSTGWCGACNAYAKTVEKMSCGSWARATSPTARSPRSPRSPSRSTTRPTHR